MGLLEGLFAGVLMITPVQAEVPETEPSAECLAMNMYHEARGQGIAGVLAVSFVVFNRVRDKRFPNTVCQVIQQGPTRESWKTRKVKNLSPTLRKYYPIRNRCQFSWWCDGRSDETKDTKLYARYLKIANGMIRNEFSLIDITDGATFYHADYVKPAWAKTKYRTIEIGDHIFYRWEVK
jgi:spore germination cell wall hydrolase CwlJ-like protein|tara:strand:- start:203 stop:739 length:537 start_codon:yes stop_codon:yes gene_type:complete